MSESIRNYETIFITKSETTDPALAALKEKVNKAIENAGGEVKFTDDWGKRKLSFNIGRHSRGQYNYILYTGKGDLVTEVERNLRLSEHLLRFLSVNLGENLDQEKYLKSYQLCVRPPKLEEKPRMGGFRDRPRGGGRFRDRDEGNWDRDDE